jgi:hypothetical protein
MELERAFSIEEMKFVSHKVAYGGVAVAAIEPIELVISRDRDPNTRIIRQFA